MKLSANLFSAFAAAIAASLAHASSPIYRGDFWKADSAVYGDGRRPSADHLNTPDKAPHGHVLDYRVSVPQSGWYALFFKGGAPVHDYFIDGSLVSYAAPNGPKAADGFAQGPSLWLEKGLRTIRLERIGRRSFPMQKFESFEIRPLQGADQSSARIRGRDVVRLGEPVTVELSSSAAGVTYSLEYAIQHEANQKDAWTPAGSITPSPSSSPKTYTAQINLPKEGMYFIRALVNGKEAPRNVFPRLHAVAVDVASAPAPAAPKLIPVADIDCVATPPVAEANGKTRITRNARHSLVYRESHDCSKNVAGPYDGNASENLSGFTYAVQVPKAQVPYLLEVEFPDDARRSVCVYHAWCQPGTNLFLKSNHGYQTKSFETGGFFPLSNTMKKQQQIIWPLSTEGRICFINMSAGTRAACSRIRISRFENDLPPAPGKAVEGGRTFAYWGEEGKSFSIMIGASRGATIDGRSVTYLEAVNRWLQMIRFYGGNALSGVGVAYQTAFWKTRALKGFETPEFSNLRLFALLAEKYNMRFIPEVFINQSYMHHVIMTAQAGPENVLCLNASGTSSGGGVNALCPTVQEAYVKMMEEIAREIGDSPAFKGVTVRADPWQFQGQFFFKSLYWGYNDSNISAFERDSGITVPKGTPTQRFQFLTSPAVKDKWVAWRCAKIGDYHRRLLNALRSNGKRNDLFFGFAGQFDQETLYQKENTLRERALASGVDPAACAASDGFSIIPAARYGSRTPNLKNRAIYDEFFLPDSIEGGLCTPHAFASYMTYMELSTAWPAKALGLDLSLTGGRVPYECSAVVAAGRSGLEKFAVVLAEQDTSYFREGGNADCFGSADVFAPWIAEFSRIPAAKFDKVPGLNDPVAVWHKTVDGVYWYYAVNKEHFPTTLTLTFADGSTASHVLEPFGLKAFTGSSANPVASASSVYPEDKRREVRTLLATAQAAAADVKSAEYDDCLSKAWAAAEAGKWWRARVQLNMAPMYKGYQKVGSIPGSVLRTAFPDKLDTQNPKNGHWELCSHSTPIDLVDFDNSTASRKPSFKINEDWRGDSVIWSESGSVTLRLNAPAEGFYNLELGVVARKAGSIVATANGRILDGTGRITTPEVPASASWRRFHVPQGKFELTLSARHPIGVYGVKLNPCMRPIPGTDWVVADKFPRYWGSVEHGYNQKLVDEGLDLLVTNDLSKLKWNYAPEGIRDALWDRGLHMPLRVSSTGCDRIISKTTIVSDRPRTATVMIAVDWWARVFVNGELVKTDVAGGGAKTANFWGWYPMFTGVVNLKQGANELVAYQNGGSLGSAICGWISEADDIITTARDPAPVRKISNGKLEAVVAPSLAGRVLSFGAPGENLLWTNPSSLAKPDKSGWINYGGEKTWVGAIGLGWRETCDSPWPPPPWCDSQTHSLVSATPSSVVMRSRTSPGEIWQVDLHRSVFFENDSLVIRSRLEERAPSSISENRKWNWSVAQAPEPKRLLVRLSGRKLATIGREARPLVPSERFGDWVLFDPQILGENGLLDLDADVLCAEYPAGWLVCRVRRSNETPGITSRTAAIFRSGKKPDPSQMYIELEFLAYGKSSQMDVLLSRLPPTPPQTLPTLLK